MTPRRSRARRPRPARSAKAVALVASIGTTTGLTAWFAATDSGGSVERTSGDASTQESPASSGANAPDTTVDSGASTTPTTTPSSRGTVETPSTTATTEAVSGWDEGGFEGTAEPTRWGDVRVEVVIDGGRIVDIVTLEAPSGRSSTYTNRSVPVLEAQAIEIQGANLDIVSGATFTSRAYADSLQAALDRAGG